MFKTNFPNLEALLKKKSEERSIEDLNAVNAELTKLGIHAFMVPVSQNVANLDQLDTTVKEGEAAIRDLESSQSSLAEMTTERNSLQERIQALENNGGERAQTAIAAIKEGEDEISGINAVADLQKTINQMPHIQKAREMGYLKGEVQI